MTRNVARAIDAINASGASKGVQVGATIGALVDPDDSPYIPEGARYVVAGGLHAFDGDINYRWHFYLMEDGSAAKLSEYLIRAIRGRRKLFMGGTQ